MSFLLRVRNTMAYPNIDPPSNRTELTRIVVRFSLVVLFVLVSIQELVKITAPPPEGLSVAQGIVGCILSLVIAAAILYV